MCSERGENEYRKGTAGGLLASTYVPTVVVREPRDGDGERGELANEVQNVLPHHVLRLLLVRQSLPASLREHLAQVPLRGAETIDDERSEKERAPCRETRRENRVVDTYLKLLQLLPHVVRPPVRLGGRVLSAVARPPLVAVSGLLLRRVTPAPVVVVRLLLLLLLGRVSLLLRRVARVGARPAVATVTRLTRGRISASHHSPILSLRPAISLPSAFPSPPPRSSEERALSLSLRRKGEGFSCEGATARNLRRKGVPSRPVRCRTPRLRDAFVPPLGRLH